MRPWLLQADKKVRLAAFSKTGRFLDRDKADNVLNEHLELGGRPSDGLPEGALHESDSNASLGSRGSRRSSGARPTTSGRRRSGSGRGVALDANGRPRTSQGRASRRQSASPPQRACHRNWLAELAGAAAAVRALTDVVVCYVRVLLQKQVQHEVHFRR